LSRKQRSGRDPRLTIAKRELSSLSREKTIVLALLIQLFVAAFSSFLVVGLTSLYDPGSVAGGAVEIGVSGEASEALERAVAEQSGTSAILFAQPAEAQAAFDAGRVDAVLVATNEPPPDGGAGSVIQVDATAPAGNIETTLIVVQIREVLQTLERQERQDRVQWLPETPLSLPEDANASPYYGFTYTVLVPLLLFLPPFISGSVAVDTVTEEIERGTLELLRVTPLRLVDIIGGKALAMTLLAPVQAALWLALLGLNGIAVANVLTLLVLVTAITVIVVGLGVGLGVTLGKRRPAQLLYSMLALAIFGTLVALPEHPATTAAKLAVGSPQALTFVHVGAYVLLGVAVIVLGTRVMDRVDPESL